MRAACEHGAACYQKSNDHLATYVHPGDADYTHGHVTFADGQTPELQTLWHLFNYCDFSGSANLNFQEFEMAVSNVKPQISRELQADVEWNSAGGLEEGHLSWVRFASWAGRVGVRLPVGIDDAPGRPRTCRFSATKGDTHCDCKDFCAVSGSQVCRCGHRQSEHRSVAAEQNLGARLVSNVPAHWQRGGGHSSSGQLVQVKDLELLSLLQRLLDSTHKTSDNWTRDRGCSLHGVNRCNPSCLHKNRAPVPSGYILTAAYRNQNTMLWARYTLARAAILQDCVGGNCKQEAVGSSRSPFDDLDGSHLVKEVNEWRLLHGTSQSSCNEICDNNFNMSLAGSGKTWKTKGESTGLPLYGRGIYFSERITKADEYVVPMAASTADEISGLCSVLVCRVVGGRTNVCTKNEINADALREQVFAGPHHSVLGDRVQELKKPYREFVVYDRDQIFPEFLLTYVQSFSGS